jgi:hypothetical protein
VTAPLLEPELLELEPLLEPELLEELEPLLEPELLELEPLLEPELLEPELALEPAGPPLELDELPSPPDDMPELEPLPGPIDPELELELESLPPDPELEPEASSEGPPLFDESDPQARVRKVAAGMAMRLPMFLSRVFMSELLGDRPCPPCSGMARLDPSFGVRDLAEAALHHPSCGRLHFSRRNRRPFATAMP